LTRENGRQQDKESNEQQAIDRGQADRLQSPVWVFGSEGRGLRRLVAETCDELAAIPMRPPLDSLNVSVAAALLLFEARRQRAAASGG